MSKKYGDVPFEAMKELTLSDVQGAEKGSERITLTTTEGWQFAMLHDQDCCEVVDVYEVVGDVADLIGSPLLIAEMSTSTDLPCPPEVYDDNSHTWTFYKLATVKGYVTIRWFGSSNGYYSEEVSFVELEPEASR